MELRFSTCLKFCPTMRSRYLFIYTFFCDVICYLYVGPTREMQQKGVDFIRYILLCTNMQKGENGLIKTRCSWHMIALQVQTTAKMNRATFKIGYG